MLLLCEHFWRQGCAYFSEKKSTNFLTFFENRPCNMIGKVVNYPKSMGIAMPFCKDGMKQTEYLPLLTEKEKMYYVF